MLALKNNAAVFESCIQYTYGKGPFGNFGERHYSSQLVSLHSFLGLGQRYYTQDANWGTICDEQRGERQQLLGPAKLP